MIHDSTSCQFEIRAPLSATEGEKIIYEILHIICHEVCGAITDGGYFPPMFGSVDVRLLLKLLLGKAVF